MTSFKLIFRNVKKNLKNYAIYFVTLMVSVSMFYAFNSIKDQPAFVELSSTKRVLSDSLNQMTSILSVLIAIVLGFLMVYANGFLLKRRKKELGIYTILGMEKSKISRLFAGETLIVGTMSLIVGIVVGIIISQGLGLIALKLFAIDLANYAFIVSTSALIKTIACFVLIFCIILLFNVKSISGLKPIELIRADRKNEVLEIKNIWIQVFLFIVSIISFVVAGIIFDKCGLLPKKGNYLYYVAPAFIVIGILLLFYSAAVVLLCLVKSNKKIYYTRLNTFLSQQIGSKIRTNFVILSVICGILTIAICGLTAGISTAIAVNKLAKESTPFDFCIEDIVRITGDGDAMQYFADRDLDFKQLAKEYKKISIYDSELTYREMFKNQEVELWNFDKDLLDFEVSIVSLSDYNKALNLQGQKEITLEENEYAINCNYEGTIEYVENFANENRQLVIGGEKLKLSSSDFYHYTYYMTSIGNNDRGSIIVPDKVVRNLKKDRNWYLIKYKPDINTDEIIQKMIPIGLAYETEGYRYVDKSLMYDMYYGMVAVVILISLYIGLIFFIICASILSLNQLAETADNVYRYGLLQKLGVDNDSLFATLFKQIGIFFLAPLIPSLCLSIFVVSKIISLVEDFMNLHISTKSWITVGIILLLYGGYFLITYFAGKNIVKEKHYEVIEE